MTETKFTSFLRGGQLSDLFIIPPKKLEIVYKIIIYENTPQQAKQQPTFTSNSALISFDEQM